MQRLERITKNCNQIKSRAGILQHRTLKQCGLSIQFRMEMEGNNTDSIQVRFDVKVSVEVIASYFPSLVSLFDLPSRTSCPVVIFIELISFCDANFVAPDQ